MIKTIFYFNLTALIFWSCKKKLKLILEFIASQPRKQTITIHILSNIKINQTLKFGQLIEYSTRNIFLEKSYIKYGGKTIFRPLSKSKLSISLDQQPKVL